MILESGYEVLVYKNLIDFINPYGYIYEIRNKINNKKYIGQTINEKGVRGKMNLESIKWHYKRNDHLINSVKLYRIENFERKIIDSAKNQEKLNEKEDFYIKKYNTMDRTKGYNTKEGGGSGKHNKETIEKMRKPKSEEHKKNITKSKMGIKNPMFGKHRSKEWKEKISIHHKNNPNSGQFKQQYFFTKKYLIEQYWVSEYNMENRILDINQKCLSGIAKENKCSIFPIRSYFKKYNISTRDMKESSMLFHMKKRGKK